MLCALRIYTDLMFYLQDVEQKQEYFDEFQILLDKFGVPDDYLNGSDLWGTFGQ